MIKSRALFKKMKKKIHIFVLGLSLSLSLFFLIQDGFLPGLSSKLTPSRSFRLLEEVLSHIREDYVEEPSPSQTMEGAYKGLVGSLDLLSSYFNQEDVSRYLSRNETGLKDIGLILYKNHGTFPLVIGMRDDSPARDKGIALGDFISALDSRSTLLMSMTEANLYLKDKKDNPVMLKILGDEENHRISLRRIPVPEEPCTLSPSPGTSGILKVHRLYAPCVLEIRKRIISKLRSETIPLVIDLRNCSEGEVEEALKFIGLFCQEENIGYFESRGGEKEFLSTSGPSDLGSLPLIIWTNRATIGPAEAVAAVLQAKKRAKIIGLQTPGLVARQKFIPFEDGSALLLTTAVFHLSEEKKIWQKGVEPDLPLGEKDQSLDAYLLETRKLLTGN